MKKVSIIGAGRLGASLGYALSKRGFRIEAFSCKTHSSLKASSQIIGEGIPSTDNVQTAKKGEIVVLSVPDDEIKKVARELSLSDLKWSKKLVFHCSGLLPAEILNSLKAKGALTASVHPVQSFSKKGTGLKAFQGTYFGLQGSTEALSLIKEIVQKLGGYSFIIQAKDKPLYHAACSIASNYFVVLLDMALILFKQIGLQDEMALQILLPLMQGTLHNVKKFEPFPSLTGPIARGDKKSIRIHLDSLRDYPPLFETYLKLASWALEIAAKEKMLSSYEIRALKNVLEGK